MDTSHAVRVLTWMAVSAIATVSHADVAPADVCTMPGQPCNNVSGMRGVEGICTPAKCQGNLYDGGGPPIGTKEYDCHRCLPIPDGGIGSKDAGARDAGGGGTAGKKDAGARDAGGGGTAGKGSTSKHDDDGCSVGRRHVGPSLALIIAALFGLAMRRRRNV